MNATLIRLRYLPTGKLKSDLDWIPGSLWNHKSDIEVVVSCQIQSSGNEMSYYYNIRISQMV